MTGKDLLKDIQNVDADLIEEAEFGSFQKHTAGVSRRKKLLLVLAAALVMATMTAAAAYTRWSSTMQFGAFGSPPPSQQVKEKAQQSGLSVIPTESEGTSISDEDQGITVTLVQTVMDPRGGKMVFRIQGLDLEEGQSPWAWWDVTVDGKKYDFSWTSQFFPGFIKNQEGELVYAKNGKPVKYNEKQELIQDYYLSDGSIEFSVDLLVSPDEVMPFGKEIAFHFTGFGVQGEKFEDEEIQTVSGNWDLSWTLEGSTQPPKKWTPNAEIGHWDLTLVEVEIGQMSMKGVYKLGEQYEDPEDFHEKNEWSITPAELVMADGTVTTAFGGSSPISWDPETHLMTLLTYPGDTVVDPEQIVGINYFAGYEINERGFREDKPYYFVSLQEAGK